MTKTIKVFSPATIGNIGPGFDVLGLAVKGMGDIVEVWKTSGNKIIIEEIENNLIIYLSDISHFLFHSIKCCNS